MHVGLSEAECRASYPICWPSAGDKGDLQSKRGKDFRTAISMTKYFKSKKPSAEPFEARVLGRGQGHQRPLAVEVEELPFAPEPMLCG